jgi:hypothetical protein
VTRETDDLLKDIDAAQVVASANAMTTVSIYDRLYLLAYCGPSYPRGKGRFSALRLIHFV